MAMEQLAGKHSVFFAYRFDEMAGRLDPSIPRLKVPFTHLYHPGSFRILADFVKKRDIECIVSTKRKEYNLCGLVASYTKIKHIIRLGIVRKLKVPIWDRILYGHLNNGIIVNAKAIEDTLRRAPYMKNHPIKLIYNGVSIPALSPPNAEDEYFTITSVGSLLPRKGFDLLIRALDYLPQDLLRRTRLCIIGSGPEEENLRRLISESKVRDAVTLHGSSVYPQDIVQESDLFVLLSLNEGVPNAVLEAMAVGVPVLVTPAGGLGEIIQDDVNGFLMDDTSPTAVAERLRNLSRRKDLGEIGFAGRNLVEREFSLEKMGSTLEEFLSEMIYGSP